MFYKIACLFIPVALLWNSCATVGSPTGGPKDEDPPVVIQYKPKIRTTKFDKKNIEIKFNEYLNISSANQELIVSPPMEKKPLVRTKGKGIIIQLEDTLKKGTTYTLNFGNAITDLNEGNILENFEYVFSTGNYIDSMAIVGKIINAFDLKPVTEPVFIGLYENFADSAPYQSVPSFIGRTSSTGEYTIRNIKTGTYRMFALKDENNNLKYDLLTEKIGFADSAVHLYPEYLTTSELILTDTNLLKTIIYDTLPVDSLGQVILDTAMIDSVLLATRLNYSAFMPLYLFQEEDEMQYLVESKRDERYQFLFILNLPVKDPFSIKPLNFTPSENWYIREESMNHDSIIFWITDTAVSNNDTLRAEISYTIPNPNGSTTTRIDSILLRYKEKKQTKPRRKEKEESQEISEYLELQANITHKSNIHLIQDLRFDIPTPIERIDTTLIKLFFQEDTLLFPLSYNWIKDSSRFRHVWLMNDWKEGSRYQIKMYPGAITDIYGHTIDTAIYAFSTRERDYYGNLLLGMHQVTEPVLVQLLNSSKALIKQYLIEKDQILEFALLNPGNYTFKLVYDENKNKQWDTGKYLEKKQAERILFNPNNIEIRSNWDIELDWFLP